MRIGFTILCVFLSACATQDNPPAVIKQGGAQAAYADCVKRGLKVDGYNYEVCNRARPEVQAHERRGRTKNLGIIRNNRSVYASNQGRSYPVE